MRVGLLVGGLLLAGAAAAQDVTDGSIEILRLRDIEEASEEVLGFPRLRQGDSGTLVIAAFDGGRLTVAITRSKGIDPPADLREVQRIARSIETTGVDFLAEETNRVSTVEMDFSEEIKREGSLFSGSVPLGKIVAELAHWKDLPKPVYVVVGSKQGAEVRVAGEARSGTTAVPAEKVSASDVVEFRVNAATWGIPGLIIIALISAGVIALPIAAIRMSQKAPVAPDVPSTIDQLKVKRREQAKAAKSMIYLPFLYVFLFAPRSLPVNPLKSGLLLTFGTAGAPPALLLLAAPFLLTALIAPAIIKHRRTKHLPAQPPTLQARTQQKLRTSIATMYIGMVGCMALLSALILTRRSWSYLVAGIPPRIQGLAFILLFLLIMVTFLVSMLKQRVHTGELLPPGHRLVDPVHDAGRGAGVHVQQVRVMPGIGFGVGRSQGGYFQLTEPLTTLLPDAEAKALIAFEVARTKGRFLTLLPALAPMLTMLIAFLFVRPVARNAAGFNLQVFFFCMFGFMVISSLVLFFAIQPVMWRKEKEALEFAVRHTGRPNDVLRALARQASLDEIKPNKKPGRKRLPIHITEKFEIVRRFAREEGMSVMEEDPFAVIDREEEGRDHEAEGMLRTFYRHFGLMELDPLMSLLAEDVEWRSRERLKGREAVRAHLKERFAESSFQMTPIEFHPREDGIEVLVDEVEQDSAGRVIRAGPERHLVTLRDGLIARWEVRIA